MKRICHMTSVHKSDDTRIFHKECVSLAKEGYEVYLVTPGESREDQGVHVIGVGDKPISRLRRMTETAKKVYLAALALNCDIYHLHDPELLPYALRLKRRKKVVIFDSHENILDYISEKRWIPSVVRRPIHLLATWYIRRTLPRLDALISVTPHLHEKLCSLNRRTYMVTNYPEINIQTPAVNERYLPGSPFLLIFAGGVTSQWNHEAIVKSIQNIQDVKYKVYGKASEEYIQQLKSIDNAGNMEYLGILPHGKVSQALTEASVGMALCQYSKNTEGKLGSIGNTKLFEYMMAGLPVVCTNFDLWRNIVDKYQCGICVDPDNSVSIEQAIIWLRDHPTEAREMGFHGRRAVEEEFNWESQAQTLLWLYKSLAVNNQSYSG